MPEHPTCFSTTVSIVKLKPEPIAGTTEFWNWTREESVVPPIAGTAFAP
jgi:hypothetical protein